MPCIRESWTASDRVLRDRSLESLACGKTEEVLEFVEPKLSESPFSPAIRTVIIEAVNHPMRIEAGRGEISRAQRSSLAATAEPYQGLIDALFYRMAGLDRYEAAGLEERLATML